MSAEYNTPTLASLARKVAPAAGIASCESLVTFFDADKQSVCLNKEYSATIRRYCPCLGQRASFEMIGVMAEKPKGGTSQMDISAAFQMLTCDVDASQVVPTPDNMNRILRDDFRQRGRHGCQRRAAGRC